MVSPSQINNEIRHHTIVSTAGDKQAVLDTLHSHLDCVDTKTSALLTYDGLLVAVLTLLISSPNLKTNLPHFDCWKVPLIASGGITIASALMCLLGLDIIGAHSKRDTDVDDYIEFAAQTSVTRTWRYRWALYMTGAASVVVLLAFFFFLKSTVR